MTRQDIFLYVKEKYGAMPEYPWNRSPNYAVLRHNDNRKWFIAIVDITEDKLNLPGNKLIDALLLKCNPIIIGSLINNEEIFPGWHMNREHWITVHLGKDIPREKIFALIDLSFSLTKK